ncbi:N-acetyl-1-D-myo-inositol-2-amino-2-deoxy-alpha-D-glucopyranoside deacetylase [Nitriliruptor alkaliphilus]|uniref:N-acetyl-1-D-myo-inositol-2-amino-2-deoxy-alpha- D-glucopyranoside deacetylase n=1 Tax=Nitriliruptor alkaliphilus TaxID=427918 RepID=UPI000696DCE1|nr:N-acetyl-1-D-myo-inositol-2-amino-2-deoxy-alpha-D-glucopyranoside deacetylase [Nitriliruptor alkaliphilus]
MEVRPTLLCVHPHPDDEAIACGGVLARTSATGGRTVVVTCTGGEAGENLAGIDLGDEDLTTHRRREMADSIAALGVDEHVWLGYRDSGMVGTDDNDHPDSFHAADLDEAARRLAAVVRRVRPDVVVSDDERGTYGHPDHIKAHHVTVRAVALAADPAAEVAGEPWSVPKRYVHTLTKTRLWQAHTGLVAAGLASPFGGADIASPDDLPFGTPDGQLTTVVDVRAWLDTKRAALLAHRSQIGADSFFINTPDDMAVALFGIEEFVLENGTSGSLDGELEDDLFAGLSAVPRTAPSDVGRGGPIVDPVRFREVLGRFVTGVTVMGTTVDGTPHGMTASSVTSVSLDPPLVLVCVDRSAAMATEVTAGGVYALSFLADDQAELSVTFADPDRPTGHDQFEGVPYRTATTGSPVLDGAVGWVDTRVVGVHDGGDHLIVVGEVVDLGHDPVRRPLAYHAGAYADLAERA